MASRAAALVKATFTFTMHFYEPFTNPHNSYLVKIVLIEWKQDSLS